MTTTADPLGPAVHAAAGHPEVSASVRKWPEQKRAPCNTPIPADPMHGIDTRHQTPGEGETKVITRRGGPYPHNRLDLGIKATQGRDVLLLVLGEGHTFRQAGAALGISATTAWRRYWFALDWGLPERYGVKARRLPPQRGTRACPRGRPWIEELDGPGGPLHRGGIR